MERYKSKFSKKYKRIQLDYILQCLCFILIGHTLCFDIAEAFGRPILQK